MPKHTYPVFNKGRILKQEMLEALRDYPYDILKLQYIEHSDGVITGMNIIVNEQEREFIVTPGLMKFKGRIYTLNEPKSIQYNNAENEQVVKIRFSEVEETLDMVDYLADIVLDDNKILSDQELELARYKLEPGAYLRSDYQDMADFATEYNTVNIIHMQYSALGNESSIHPDILKRFAKELVKYKAQNSNDIQFAFQCLNNRSISRETILYYIASRSSQAAIPLNNRNLHEMFVEIIKEVQKTPNSNLQRSGRASRILVD